MDHFNWFCAIFGCHTIEYALAVFWDRVLALWWITKFSEESDKSGV